MLNAHVCCFTCLCTLTHRKVHQFVNDISACTGNACVHICTPLQAFIHETDANSELQRYTEELQDRAPLPAQSDIQFWLDRESSYSTTDCLVAPCRLRGCKNWPAPFPGRMSYKVTKPGLVSVLYLSMRYTVLLFIRAPFYVLLVFIAMCAVLWLF